MNGLKPAVDSPARFRKWVIKGRQQKVLPPFVIIKSNYQPATTLCGGKGGISYSTQLGADVLGNLTRLSNLANGIEPSIEKTRNMQIQLEQQLASAEEEVKRPFPQATELTEKSKRLAVLEGLLNMNDKDIVTDTEPEQQCQTDNRQRGQEER